MEEKSKWERIKETLLRLRTEIVLVSVCVALALTLPAQAWTGVVSLFITKVMFISVGILIAHVSRRYLFPYIDLSKAVEEKQWQIVAFMGAWYAVIVYACATGG